MEHVEGNLLSDFLMKRGESLDEVTTRKLFHQLISGVSFIHGRDKTHRNISLATLAVDESGAEPALKILTFEHMSIADSLSSIQSNPLAGSALYTPPEVFLNSVNPEQAAEDVTGAFDVWSCGIVLYLMLYGSHPFLPLGAEQLNPAETVTVMIENSVKGMIQFPGLSSISDLSTDLLRRILVPATHKRYTVSQILSHPWLSSIQLPEPSAIIPLRQVRTSRTSRCLNDESPLTLLSSATGSRDHSLNGERGR